jgi:hypothetical protein
MTEDLLGLKLEDALNILREAGEREPAVRRLSDRYPDGTERVVRVRPGEIVTARFYDVVAS